MFLKETLFAVLLLIGFAAAIGMSLSLYSGLTPAFTPEKSSPKPSASFKQTRLNVQRDIYGEREKQPAHATLRCQEAEFTYDTQTKELSEYMSDVEGHISHKGIQDLFSADIATYNHQQQHITASAVKTYRYEGEHRSLDSQADYTEAWITPQGLRFDAKNIHAQDGKTTPMTLDARNASYSGSMLKLDGDVAIGQLTMGNLIADRAIIDPTNATGDFSGNLSVLSSAGAQLHADHCHVNRAQGIAVFTAADKVSYHDANFEERKPLELTCQQLTIQGPTTDSQDSISQIIAQGQVEATYDNGWELSAHRAIYHSGPNRRLTVDAYPQGGCVVTSPDNDNLVAKRIESALSDNQVTFYELLGELRDGQTSFYADKATWNHLSSVLTCYQETRVFNPLHGSFQAEGDLKATFEQAETGLTLATAQHQGSIAINGMEKQLTCQGHSFLDHQNKQITITADDNSCVHFNDLIGQLEAEKLRVWYLWGNRTFATTKLIAEGKVHLQRPSEGSAQLALADQLEYLPEQEKIRLSANSPNRVLYYDPSRQMTASARGVDIIRDPQTRKMILQGKGDVKFKLMEAELQAMRQYLQGIEKNGKK